MVMKIQSIDLREIYAHRVNKDLVCKRIEINVRI